MKDKLLFFFSNCFIVAFCAYIIYDTGPIENQGMGSLIDATVYFMVFIIAIVWFLFNLVLRKFYKLQMKKSFYIMSSIMIIIQVVGIWLEYWYIMRFF